MFIINKKYVSTHTIEDITSYYGCSKSTVYRFCKRCHTSYLKNEGKFDRELEKLAGTDTDKKIGEIIGCSGNAVFHYRVAHNIEPYHRLDFHRIKELYLSTHSYAKVAKELGVSRQRIWQIFKDRGINLKKTKTVKL